MNDNPQPKRDAALADALPENQDTTVPATDQPSQQKKRRSRPLVVLLLLLAVAVLGGTAAILSYQYFMPQKTSEATSQQVVIPTKLTAKSVIAGLSPLYKNSSLSEGYSVTVPIKVASYDYYTQTDATKAVGITGSVAYTDSAIVTAKIAKNLKEKQFVEKIVQAGDDDSEYIAHYTQSDVVCDVATTKTANNPTGNHEIRVACTNMADYIAAAAAQKPFYAVYPRNQIGDETSLLFVGMPVTTTSKTAGYKTATVSMSGVQMSQVIAVGGFAGLFYQTPDKQWHFFVGAQNMLQCSAYNTDDLKKAYVGTTCGDATGKEALVTL